MNTTSNYFNYFYYRHKRNLAQQTWYAAAGERSRLFQLTVDVHALTPSWWIERRQRLATIGPIGLVTETGDYSRQCGQGLRSINIDDQLTHFGKLQMAITLQCVIRSPSCLI